MRLHQLQVAAFGPFADEVSIDFDGLCGHGIFLLTGPTGAGKTSVLDAVCFALYGGVPGARQQAKRLRSDHAARTTRTRVQLDVTLRGRRLRITREPEQARPKQRGTGTTVDKARAILEQRIDDEWAPVSTRLDEIGHEIELLLGMSREQFCQVVLLPQGEFAAFLRADADGRRALLQRLFAVERFEAVEGQLREQRIDAVRERDAVRVQVDETIARLAEVGGDRDGCDDADPLPWAEEIRETAHKRLLTATAAAAATRTTMHRARARHKAAEELATRQEQYADAVRRRALLDAQRVDVMLAESELGAARRAGRVAPLLAAAAATAGGEAAAKATALAAREDLALEPEPGPSLAQQAVAVLSARVTDLRGEIGELHAVLPLESQAADHAAGAVGHRGAATHAAEQAQAHDEWLVHYDTARPGRVDQLTTTQQLAVLVASRRAAVRAAGERLSAAGERDRLQAEHTRQQESILLLADTAQDAREHWIDLRERRITGMATELAGRLSPGEPCPVCGSPDHPGPAGGNTAPVHADDEAVAEAAWGAAEQERRRAEDTLNELATALAAAAARSGAAALDRLREELQTAQATLTEAEKAAATAATLAAELAGLDAERTDRERMRAELRQREHAESAHASKAQQSADEAATTLAAHRGDDASIATRSDRLQRLADCIDAAILAERDLMHARSAAKRAQGAAVTAAKTAGFRDLDDAADAGRDERRVGELDAIVRAFSNEEAALRERLADATLVTAAAAPSIDVTTALVELEEAEATLRILDGDCGAAQTAATAVDRLHQQLTAELTALRPLDEWCALVSDLSRLVDGTATENERRMSLSAYVLAARLEQVAAAATQRLLQMSAGRYSLVHTDERDSHNKRSGLSLAVVDGWTGQQRPTTTLSGGESFFASLSLALGLADVVTSEAGGAPLETLFVDEGFGSLDDDTLDEVMTVLDGLRDGGRVVALVSHVAELKQRIPAQLHVSKGSRGSRVHMV